MNDHQEQPSVSAKNHWPPIMILSFVILVLVLFVAYRLSLSLKIAVRLRAISSAGYPVSVEDLGKCCAAIPDEENAALIFGKAFAQLKLDSSRTTNMPLFPRNRLPPRTATMPLDRRKQIADLLDANRRSLELLHQGATLPKSRYAIDLTPGSNRSQHLDSLRNSARLLCLEAVLHAEAGQLDDAVRSLETCIVLAQSLSTEPVLYSESIRIACLDSTRFSLERILSQNRLNNTQLLKLAKAFSCVASSSVFDRALAGERCYGIQVYESSVRESVGSAARGSTDEFDVTSIRSPFGLFLYKASGLFQRDFVFYLDAMKAHIATANLPFPEQFRAATNLVARLEEKTSQTFLVISRTLIPPLSTAIIRNAENFARLQAVQVGLALEQYRLANQDKLPENVGELSPTFLKTVPIDPFDGEPIRYRKLAKGYIVYSIGSDGIDNAGAERQFRSPGGNPSTPYDITFTVER